MCTVSVSRCLLAGEGLELPSRHPPSWLCPGHRDAGEPLPDAFCGGAGGFSTLQTAGGLMEERTEEFNSIRVQFQNFIIKSS